MARGGSGRGQGRKPTLSYYDRIRVGARCETLWRRAIERRLAEKVADTFDGAYDEYANLQRIPVSMRAAYVKRHKERLEFDIEADIRTRLGLEGNEPYPLVTTVSVSRPKGLKPAIIERVSKCATRLCGTPVSNRLVEACWKDFRRLESRLRSDSV